MRSLIWGAASMALFLGFVIGLRIYQDIFDREFVEADRAPLR